MEQRVSRKLTALLDKYGTVNTLGKKNLMETTFHVLIEVQSLDQMIILVTEESILQVVRKV